jgi:KDO2-lipid IV(A) lauroyltransferase
LKRAAEVAAIESLMGFARLLPRRIGQAVFSGLGGLAARFFRRDRTRAVDNLGIAFPEMPEPFRRALAAAMFRSLGRNAYEFLRLRDASAETVLKRVERVEGLENLEAAARKQQGILAITGHIGCWELMPAYFVARGYKTSVVGRRMRVTRMDERLSTIRAKLGVISIDRDANPRKVFEPLRRKEALGVLIDQHTRVAGEWVPFFGRPAHTPTAVAKMALVTGAPIVPMAIFLRPNGRHVIHVLPAVSTDGLEGAWRAQQVPELPARCSWAVEHFIRIEPKLWVWFHHRWRDPDTRHDGVEAVHAVQS